MAKEKCEGCRFYGGHEVGECKRHAPQGTVPNEEDPWSRAFFPMVSMDDWCGDYERKKPMTLQDIAKGRE